MRFGVRGVKPSKKTPVDRPGFSKKRRMSAFLLYVR
jgi:hypothetical protein